MVRIAGRAGRIDRERHDLMVDPVEEQVKACAPTLAFEPDAKLDGQVLGGHQHIVHQPDRIGKTSFGIAFGDRQARRQAFLEARQA